MISHLLLRVRRWWLIIAESCRRFIPFVPSERSPKLSDKSLLGYAAYMTLMSHHVAYVDGVEGAPDAGRSLVFHLVACLEITPRRD